MTNEPKFPKRSDLAKLLVKLADDLRAASAKAGIPAPSYRSIEVDAKVPKGLLTRAKRIADGADEGFSIETAERVASFMEREAARLRACAEF